MSVTTNEWLDEYVKMFDGDMYKNNEGFKAGIENLQKAITGSDFHKQVQAWGVALNDPESSINKSMRMWSEFSKNIDYEKLAGLQTGLKQLADQIPKYDTSALAALQTFDYNKLFSPDTEIGKNFTEAYDYAYETTESEVGEPDIDKEELKNTIIEEIKTNQLDEVDIENSKFQKNVYAILGINMIAMLLYLLQKNSDNGFIYYLISKILEPAIVKIMGDYLKEIMDIPSSGKKATVNIHNLNIGCTFYGTEEQNKQ